MRENPYPTDLTDAQWQILGPLLPPPFRRGRPRKVNLREVVNALLYLNREGCSWRALPRDFPKWKCVYNYFDDWKRDGTWGRLLDALRKKVRAAAGKDETPSAASIDSQSVDGCVGGREQGKDAFKKVNGRKRHVVVDTLGLVLAVFVSAASIDDGAAAPKALAGLDRTNYPRLTKIWADNKYHNKALYVWIKEHSNGGWELEIKSRPEGAVGFVVIPKRWVVERTFAWLGNYRRHARDYEHRTDSSEAMVKVSSIHLMLRRLTNGTGKHGFKKPEKTSAKAA